MEPISDKRLKELHFYYKHDCPQVIVPEDWFALRERLRQAEAERDRLREALETIRLITSSPATNKIAIEALAPQKEDTNAATES